MVATAAYGVVVTEANDAQVAALLIIRCDVDARSIAPAETGRLVTPPPILSFARDGAVFTPPAGPLPSMNGLCPEDDDSAGG